MSNGSIGILIQSLLNQKPLVNHLQMSLRKMGIPVVNFSPSKGNDKHTRVNSVAPLFESGMIWAPMQDFAEEVIEECAAFPFGDNDDLVDSTTQAIMRFRQGGFVLHPDDYKEDPQPQRKRIYY
jgi:predicted phage terminase large subunit-like protein